MAEKVIHWEGENEQTSRCSGAVAVGNRCALHLALAGKRTVQCVRSRPLMHFGQRLSHDLSIRFAQCVHR